MRARMFFLLLCFSFGMTLPIWGQDKDPPDKEEVIRVDTQLVRAKHGDASGVRGAAWLWPASATAAA